MQLHKLQTYADPVLDRQLEELFRMLAKPTGSGAPAILPRYVGDEYLDETAGIWYKAAGLTVGSWQAGNRFGVTPDYSEFEADGTLVAHGAATVYDDINVSLVAQTSGAATPTSVAFKGDAGAGALKCLAFSGTNPTPDEIPSSLEILHGLKEGTDITLHVHWYPTDTTVGNVKWQVRYVWFNRGTVPGAPATATVTQATGGVAWQEETAVFTLSGVGKTMGSRLVFNIFRDAADAADTYAHLAAVTDVGVHYEKDTQGSRTVNTK